MSTEALVTNLISARVAYSVATDADVPGIEGSSATNIALYNRADLGWRVLVRSNGHRYTKTDPRAFAAGSRITSEDVESGNATSLQGRAVAATAPTSGQALAWDGTSWTPTTITSTPLSNATPIAVSGVGTPGVSGNASRADHVHPATGLGVLSANQTFTGNNLWNGGGYQLVGFETSTNHIGFFDAPPKAQAAAPPAVTLNPADVAASFTSLSAWISAIQTGLNATGGVGLFAG